MFDYRRHTDLYPNPHRSQRQISLLMIPLLVGYLISGCNSPLTIELYENPGSGVRLQKPKHWELAFYERSGLIVLQGEDVTENVGSARIEIHGSACGPASSTNPDRDIELEIDRIRILYDLESVTRVQEPVKVEIANLEVTKAVIALPTSALPEGSTANQVGGRESDVLQPIEVFALRSASSNHIVALVYKGHSEALNAEAERIISSIQITCSTAP